MNEYIHKVKYYECDRMGVTHHSNYVRFMEEARIDFLDRMGFGFEKMEEDGIVSPVVKLNVEYKKPTTFQDEIRISVDVLELSALKLKLGYTMTCGEYTVCTAESTHCFLEGGRPVSLEGKYPELTRKLKELL